MVRALSAWESAVFRSSRQDWNICRQGARGSDTARASKCESEDCYAVNVRPFRIRAVPPTPSEQIPVNTYTALYLKTLQRVQQFFRKDVRVIFEFDLTTFLHRFKRGEYRETHSTLVCWSGWTNCWKSKNSQQIFLADNFSGAEWVSLSSYQVFLHDMHLNICVLVGLHVGL